ncbi:histidine phosphatase superfamily [Podospora australis]|uniref:Histidine phosphatase superfamily n=1 Tax=Podospora australis TaxID=1536484 RepID=A0AAN6WYY7_9PEZI|nr:histidine phosphatase superfamily [Podospora australis]
MAIIYVHLVRHAQGFHNLCEANHALPDPDLTPLGEEQCLRLRQTFGLHEKVTYLVASPLRRTIYTCLLSFEPAILAGKKKIIALPDLQEVSPFPCDTGSEVEDLVKEFGEKVDFGRVQEGWNDKGPGSEFAPEMRKLEARAARARRWFWELGQKEKGEEGEEEVNIVAVTHGGFLHFLTEDWDGMDVGRGTGWDNTECRTYEVVAPESEGGEGEQKGKGNVRLVETKESWRRRRGSAGGLTETEQMELRAAVGEVLEGNLFAPKKKEGRN